MYVFVNAAMSADGKISDRTRSQIALSSEEDFERVDGLRAESDAVLVGVGTVLTDDPSLTVKDEKLRAESGNPIRVVLDSRGRTPDDAAVLDERAPTVVAVSEEAPEEELDALYKGATVVRTEGDDGRVDLHALIDELERRGVERLMIEGGGDTIYSFLREGLVDELYVYVAPVFVGGSKTPTLADGDGFVEEYVEATLEEIKGVGEGVVLKYVIEGK